MIDDVVAIECRDGYEREVAELQAFGELRELLADVVEDRFVVVDQIHLVDADDQMFDAQKRSDHGMSPALFA